MTDERIRELRSFCDTVRRCGRSLLDASFLSEALDEIERLRDLVREYAEDVLLECGHRQEDGWIDSCARNTAVEAGDRLVDMGLYERHPDGHGRRQWYRRKER